MAARRTDPRSRKTTQGVIRTYGGLDLQNDGDLSGTADVTFRIPVPAAAGTYTYRLPPHLYGNTYSVEVGTGGTCTVTLTKADNGSGAVTLLAAATNVAAANIGQSLSNDYDNTLDYDGRETLTLVVAGTPAAEGIIALHMHVADNGWK